MISNSSEPIKTECALSPISDSSLKQYLINCNGQISGSLISKLATTISHDSVLNVINVHNLNYSYTSADYGELMFNYLTTQPLVPDTYYTNAWNNTFTVLINGKQLQSNSLTIVNDYH